MAATQVVNLGSGNTGLAINGVTLDVTGVALNNVLQYNGTKFVPAAVGGASLGNYSFTTSTFNMPVNAIFSGAASATNTVALSIAPNVADGASSVALDINTGTTLANATADLVRIRNNGLTKLEFRLGSSDGIKLVDGGGSASLTLSTAAGITMAYASGGSVQATSTAAILTSPSTNGVISTDDGTGSKMAYSGNQIVVNSGGTTVSGAAFISGTGAKLDISAAASTVSLNVTGASSTPASQATFKDSNGKAHFGVDAYGLPSIGALVDSREDWRWASGVTGTTGVVTNSANAWSLAAAGTPTGISFGTITGLPWGQNPILNPSTANANSQSLLGNQTAMLRVDQLTNLYAVMEFSAIVSQTGANNATYYAGVANANISSAANPRGWWFERASGSTNWHFKTNDGTTTNDITTGTAIDTNVHMFRIEWYGSATTLGAKTVKAYIDGTQVANTTTNVDPGANGLVWQFVVKNTGVSTSPTLSIGPLRTLLNLVATPLVP